MARIIGDDESFVSELDVLVQAKSVAHIWELGGGTSLAKLLDSPINESTIRFLCILCPNMSACL